MASAHFDYIIIGSGAGGGTLAFRLAKTGKRILVLERGGYLPREPENWDAHEIFVKGRYRGEQWYDKHDRAFHPELYYCVGGNTKVYGAVLARFRREDFQAVQHPDAVSPAWPLSYEDFERYYCTAERLYQVHGARDDDPTEPPASEPYPFPAIQHEPRIQQLSDALTQLGYHPSHLPMAVQLDEQRPWMSACLRCNNCGGFPCMVHAKCDAEVIAMRPAMQHPNVTLLTGALVTRLLTSPSGKEIREVVVEHQGNIEHFSASIVILSAGACNSARLLLQSANDQHPRGLANSSDQVGRNFMLHHRTALVAFFRQPNPTRFQVTLGLNDFYHGEKDFPFPMGRLQMLGKLRGEMMRGKTFKLLPLAPLDWLASHSIEFLLTGEDLPDPNNRVTVDGHNRLKISYTPNNTSGIRRLTQRMQAVLKQVGRKSDLFSVPFCVTKVVDLEGIGHQSGTCRLGVDPQTSVVNLDCRTHDIENLYVVDGSFFPSIGSCNPTLTIIANALRVGDHLESIMGSNQLVHINQPNPLLPQGEPLIKI